MEFPRTPARAPADFAAALRRRHGVLTSTAVATDPRAAHVTEGDEASRTIAVSVNSRDGRLAFKLSAADAAELMFQIGYALEQAATSPKIRPRPNTWLSCGTVAGKDG